VRLAVWLRALARELTARIDGRVFALRPPECAEGYWEGVLRPAGVLRPTGALRPAGVLRRGSALHAGYG
jgi:hypothetical protein